MAVFSAAARSANVGILPSTTTILQSGQAADTIDTSSVSSTPQPSGSALGNGDGLPCWLTIRRQPLAVVHGGSPYSFRYTPRSDARCGVLNASTMPMVWPAPLVSGSLYADSMLLAPHPLGVVDPGGTRRPAAFSAIALFTAISGAYSARHRSCPGRATGHAARIAAAGTLPAVATPGTAVSAAVAVRAAPAAMAILVILIRLLPALGVGTCSLDIRSLGGRCLGAAGHDEVW